MHVGYQSYSQNLTFFKNLTPLNLLTKNPTSLKGSVYRCSYKNIIIDASVRQGTENFETDYLFHKAGISVVKFTKEAIEGHIRIRHL